MMFSIESDPPSNTFVIVGIVIVFFVTWLLVSVEKAFLAAMTVGIFGAVIQTKWNSRHDVRFWVIISTFFIAHALIIILIKFPKPEIGLAFAPVAMIDGFVMWGMTNWIERRFPRHKE